MDKKKLLLITLIVIILLAGTTAVTVQAKAHYDVYHIFMDSTDETYILWACRNGQPAEVTQNGNYGLIILCK